jgi:hypothetical protein
MKEGIEMALTPDETRSLTSTKCLVCETHIPVNRQAIIYESRHTGETQLIGDCCADEYLGAVMQDYANALTKPQHAGWSFPSYWITSDENRARRIVEALRRIADAYERAILGFTYRSGGKGK